MGDAPHIPSDPYATARKLEQQATAIRRITAVRQRQAKLALVKWTLRDLQKVVDEAVERKVLGPGSLGSSYQYAATRTLSNLLADMKSWVADEETVLERLETNERGM